MSTKKKFEKEGIDISMTELPVVVPVHNEGWRPGGSSGNGIMNCEVWKSITKSMPTMVDPGIVSFSIWRSRNREPEIGG
jgi:hypothetical protein